MRHKSFVLIGLFVAVSMLFAACSSSPPPGDAGETTSQEPVVETVIVKETVVVTVEVPGEAPAATPEVKIEVAPAPGFGETLKAVQARGKLICGVNGQLPGFSFLDPSGAFNGFDVDYISSLE